jgi:hypothetical protein
MVAIRGRSPIVADGKGLRAGKGGTHAGLIRPSAGLIRLI